jgi:NADH dehydrogenase FAD-containing subunit
VTEYAGEIKDLWPEKKVTIVQGDSQLLNKTYPNKFRVAVERGLVERGVEIIFGDYIDEIPEPGANVITRKGKTIEADLVIQARGPRPNTAFIHSLGSDALTENGLVKIRPTLQLSNYSEIFAGGDVIDWPEQKQAAKAGGHAKLIAANILAYLNNGPLKDYGGSPELIIVTNGKVCVFTRQTSHSDRSPFD